MRQLFFCYVLSCQFALFLSIYPGVLMYVAVASFCLSIFWVPIVLVACISLLVIYFHKSEFERKREFVGQYFVAAFIVGFFTFLLIVTNVPRRMAFLASRPFFAAEMAKAPVGEPIPNGRLLGFYYVDYAADPRGGVYFRVCAGPDGIGPDILSFGFAYKPNSQGTPFGESRYRTDHFMGDWYCFRVSDD